MTWFGWTFVVAVTINTLMVISMIGKPRKPIEAPAASFIVLINGLLIWGAIAVGTTS